MYCDSGLGGEEYHLQRWRALLVKAVAGGMLAGKKQHSISVTPTYWLDEGQELKISSTQENHGASEPASHLDIETP